MFYEIFFKIQDRVRQDVHTSREKRGGVARKGKHK